MVDSQVRRSMNAILKNRRACILKKARELSVLCEIRVCAVVVDPNGKVHTWPENHVEAVEFLKQFKNGEEKKQSYGGVNAIAAGNGQTDERKTIDKLDFSCFDDKLIDGLSRDSVIEISNMLKSKIEAARNRAEFLKKKMMAVRNEGFQQFNPTLNFEPDLFNGNPNFDPNFYFPQLQSTSIRVPDSYFGQEQFGAIGLGNNWNCNSEPEVLDHPPSLSYFQSVDNGCSVADMILDYPYIQ